MSAGTRVSQRTGFTLVEALLVLALMALLSGVLILGSANLLDSGNDDPEVALLAALQKVRRTAVERDVMIELRIEDDGTLLVWGEQADEALRLPVVENVRARLLAPTSLGAVLIGGEAEERALSSLRIYPDGTCDLARLEIRRNGARRLHDMDPLTCAPLPGEDL